MGTNATYMNPDDIGYHRWSKIKMKIGSGKTQRLSCIIEWLYSEACQGYWVISPVPSDADYAIFRLSDDNSAFLFRIKWT